MALSVIPTPIGNLGDITLRGLEKLRSAQTILAEDTRTATVLLRHFDIKKPLQSFHIFNEHRALQGVLQRLKEGEEIALISDAGTPGISDPGFLLIRACLQEEIPVECLPGPTAFVPALLKSGFPTDRFVFEGFLPHKKGRSTRIRNLANETRTIILYESPHRLVKLLQQLQDELGGTRRVSVSRELTKYFEETRTGPLADVLAHFAAREVKGEIVVVVHGCE